LYGRWQRLRKRASTAIQSAQQPLRQGRAREQELTPRQREMVFLYYDRGLKMSQIAQKLGVNRSTVSRTVKRAKQRLYRCLRYAL